MKRLFTILILTLLCVGVFSAFAFAGTCGGHDTTGVTSPSTTWYFAEGYTGTGFDEWLCLQNPNSTSSSITVTFMFRSGGAQIQTLTLGANTRETISVNSVVGTNKEVSIKVESTQPIVAERPMYFNYQGKWQGGHSTIGAKSASKYWYFAEGYTGPGFETWLTLLNPAGTDAAVDVHYKYRHVPGQPPRGVTRTRIVPANSRETIDVNADAGSNEEVSITVESTQPIVAERPIYFNYQNNWPGGHNTIGAIAPSKTWYFAEGYTGSGFDTWLTVLNPTGVWGYTERIDVTYMFRDGSAPQQESIWLGPQERETISVNQDIGNNREFSIKVECDVSIVVERPMYFDYRNKMPGGHDTMGATSTNTSWYFAEGYTGPGFEEWLTLLNPNSINATATITYMYRGAGTKTVTKTIAANSRETVNVNTDAGSNKEVSVKVESSQPIIVERPMYFCYQGSLGQGQSPAGEDVLSEPSPPSACPTVPEDEDIDWSQVDLLTLLPQGDIPGYVKWAEHWATISASATYGPTTQTKILLLTFAVDRADTAEQAKDYIENKIKTSYPNDQRNTQIRGSEAYFGTHADIFAILAWSEDVIVYQVELMSSNGPSDLYDDTVAIADYLP